MDDVKKSEIFEHLLKTDKVKLNWLATVCLVSIDELIELASNYKLKIDNEGNIYAPKKESIIKEMNEHIRKIEEKNYISSLMQCSFLEMEFLPEVVTGIESLFKKEGIVFRKKTYILRIDESGISIKNKGELLLQLHWHEIKSIRCRETKKDELLFKRPGDSSFTFSPSESAFDLIALPFLLASLTSRKKEFDRIETISYNALIFSLEDGNYKHINTNDFKLEKKNLISTDYDPVVIIIEHFFNKIKRKQLGLEQDKWNKSNGYTWFNNQ